MKIAKNKFFVQQNKLNVNAIQWANALAIELMQYKVALSEDLFLAVCHSDNASDFCAYIRANFTVGNLNKPLFKNWETRTTFSDEEFVIQILGYIFQFCGNDMNSIDFRKNILSEISANGFITLELATEESARAYFTTLLDCNVAQDKKTQKELADLAKLFGPGIAKFIKSDEARIAVLLNLPLKDGLRDLRCRPEDVMRYAGAKSKFEFVKLPSNIKYVNLKWSERKTICEFLNAFDFDFLSEKMSLNQEAWKRFFYHIHLFTQKEFLKYETLQIAARVALGHKYTTFPDKLKKTLWALKNDEVIEFLATDNTCFRSFASRITSAIVAKNGKKLVELLHKNPNYALRNIATVSNGFAVKDQSLFIDFCREHIKLAPADLLFSILQIDCDAKYRIIDVKGNTLIEEANYSSAIKDIQGDIRRTIQARWGVNKVVVDDSLSSQVVPFLAKNSNLGRGTRIKLTNEKYIYFFTHWVEQIGRTDIDLSFVAIDSKGDHEIVWFRSKANGYMSHSGDLTSAPAPNGATEYGRIDLDNIPENIKYIFPCSNVYTGENFDKLIEAYSGFILSSNPKFHLKQNNNRFELDAPAKANVPFVLDVKSKEIVVLDFYNRQPDGITAHAEIAKMGQMIETLSKPYMTMGRFAELLSTGAGEKVISIVPKSAGDNQLEPNQLGQLFA